jgi:hypothetical protein
MLSARDLSFIRNVRDSSIHDRDGRALCEAEALSSNDTCQTIRDRDLRNLCNLCNVKVPR